jgi:hypothetical protein
MRRYSITSSARASSAFGAERPGGFEVDDQLELGRLKHRQIGRLVTLENPSGVDTSLTISIGEAGSIGDQPARRNVFAPTVDRRHRVLRGERNDLVASISEECITAN